MLLWKKTNIFVGWFWCQQTETKPWSTHYTHLLQLCEAFVSEKRKKQIVKSISVTFSFAKTLDFLYYFSMLFCSRSQPGISLFHLRCKNSHLSVPFPLLHPLVWFPHLLPLVYSSGLNVCKWAIFTQFSITIYWAMIKVGASLIFQIKRKVAGAYKKVGGTPVSCLW